jgi:hypothetical protein
MSGLFLPRQPYPAVDSLVRIAIFNKNELLRPGILTHAVRRLNFIWKVGIQTILLRFYVIFLSLSKHI